MLFPLLPRDDGPPGHAMRSLPSCRQATAHLPESVNTGPVFTDPFLTDLLFIELLGQTVDAAMYWQEPYDDDRILEHSASGVNAG